MPRTLRISPDAATLVPAAKYRRISDDDEGLELGVKRQNDDLDQRVLDGDYTVAPEHDYCDNDISASTRSKKVRPEYQRMLADARAGKFKVIIAYTASRITRKPRENEDLIELAERHGIRFDYIRSPSFDLNTADGRLIARYLAAGDAAEAERTGERVSRKRLQIAQMGGCMTPNRPYGYRTALGPLEPVEAEQIRAAAAYVLAGGYLAKLVTDWNTAGIPTSTGGKWSRPGLRTILRSPRIAGYTQHRGELVHDAEGKPARGKWPAILDDATWQAVRARLDVNRASIQPNRAYLLSGTIRCTCGTLMSGSSNIRTHGLYNYRCSKNNNGCGHRAVNGLRVDRLIEDWVQRKLTGIKAAVVPKPWLGQSELDDAAQRKAEVLAAYRAKKLTGTIAFGLLEELEAEIKTLSRAKAIAEKASMTPTEAQKLWDTGDINSRREVVKQLLSAILVHPSAQRGGTPHFDYERIEPIERG